MKGNHLLIVDAQKDFCDKNGALSVPGATEDMERLRNFIINNYDVISGITVSLDTHSHYHIAHPIFWVNEANEHPSFFTTITAADVHSGKWRAANPKDSDWAMKYVAELTKNGRYELTIWPPHCISGTEGFLLCDAVQDAIKYYEEKTASSISYLFKGANPLTEHYSIMIADVSVQGDRQTELNYDMLKSMMSSKKVLVAGEALSHCVANSVIDISVVLNYDLANVILLEDCTSNVLGFKDLGDKFIKKASSLGMTLATTNNVRGYL